MITENLLLQITAAPCISEKNRIFQFWLAEKRVQITNGFWLAENTKEITKKQSDLSCFNNKI